MNNPKYKEFLVHYDRARREEPKESRASSITSQRSSRTEDQLEQNEPSVDLQQQASRSPTPPAVPTSIPTPIVPGTSAPMTGEGPGTERSQLAIPLLSTEQNLQLPPSASQVPISQLQSERMDEEPSTLSIAELQSLMNRELKKGKGKLLYTTVHGEQRKSNLRRQ